MARQPTAAEKTAALQAEVAALRADMAGIADLLASLTRPAGDTVAGLEASLQDRAEAIASAAHAATSAARARMAEATEWVTHNASGKVDDILTDATAYAREKPANALMFAGVAGLLVGLLFWRR
ncbi:MAG: hypothetical protein V4712_16205 [Pseudomonadota bacterium]